MRKEINRFRLIFSIIALLANFIFAQEGGSEFREEPQVKDSLKSQNETIKIKSDTGKEYTIQKHSDVISRENIDKVLGPQKKGEYINYFPLRSYIFPNYTGLTDQQLLEHFENYLKSYKNTNLPFFRILEYYYSQYDLRDLSKDLDIYDEKLRLDIILVAELFYDHGLYTDPKEKIEGYGNARLYEFEITDIIKDNYNFYKKGDKIKCYNPPFERLSNGGIDFFVPLIKEGQKVVLYMTESYDADGYIFHGNNFDDDEKELYLNPYVTKHFNRIYKNTIGVDKLNLDTLKFRAEELKSKKTNFYKINFNAK